VDTALSLSTLCRRLRKEGARRVFVCASHGVFSGNAMTLIDLSPVERVIVTDTISLPTTGAISSKIVRIPVGKLLASVIESEVHGSAADDDAYEVE